MTANETKVTKLEKTIAEQHPEVKEWIPVFLIDGKYYRHSNDETPMPSAELEELESAPDIGLIVVRYTDTPIPAENLKQEDKDE